MIDALIAAVERGVHVTLLVPGEHHDKRFIQIAGEEAYQELLDAGVDIRTYEVSMMHAKVMTVDGRIATVGSTNFNRRSMQHDEEANVVLVDEAVVGVLDRHFDDDLTNSIELDPSRWADREPPAEDGREGHDRRREVALTGVLTCPTSQHHRVSALRGSGTTTSC